MVSDGEVSYWRGISASFQPNIEFLAGEEDGLDAVPLALGLLDQFEEGFLIDDLFEWVSQSFAPFCR